MGADKAQALAQSAHGRTAPPSPPAKATAKPLSAPQKALRKLGLVRPIDLALHLPLRYEDETRITRLADAREGESVQIEGVVTACEVSLGGRRQLLVTLDDGTDTCTLRFFTFYPSHQKALAVGTRIRARGELRGGFLGWTLMHPSFQAAGGELPQALTPVYPTSAGLPQAYLRRAVLGGLNRADLSDTLPPAATLECPGLRSRLRLRTRPEATDRPWSLREALHFLHHPTPDVPLAALEDRSHPAWQRLKAEELLAQQLSQHRAKQERAGLRAPALPVRPGGLHEQLLARCRSSSPPRSAGWATRLPTTWPGPCPCTVCCKATWAAAKPWSPHWPPPWPWTTAGSAP
jgi:ATP-dependent DNA helicase RecG